MNQSQISKSNNLNEITAEINIYKQQAGQAVFEIGRRLKFVKENDLTHGQWIPWIESMEIDRSTATRLIQAFEQFGNDATSHHLPTGKIFEMLSLPESVDRHEFIQKSHSVPSTGDEKTVNEMSVRELREVKQKLKEAEQREKQVKQEAEKAKKNAQHFEALWTCEKDKPPQLIVQEPNDYTELKSTAQELNNRVVQLEREKRQIESSYQEKVTQKDQSEHALRELKKSFKNIITFVTTEQMNAIFNYSMVEGHVEAHKAVEQFLHQFDEQIKGVFDHWNGHTKIIDI
ncbi:hypothetical protein BVG16_13630 [Paenibacillus selenitireducens]|uniref:DUF3102 domain-containing protein n=1 Tax=Paenibacillus selenitireducens TaxID=1324314 RepID=A0A1T2XCB7_9BACL|nr:DUF3102 domain-containing protein [Paenibacillus selenitireducens]OPA77490.1 hypothetical protein BVG16_13630 [Paenibacillus selenitireducens]